MVLSCFDEATPGLITGERLVTDLQNCSRLDHILCDTISSNRAHRPASQLSHTHISLQPHGSDEACLYHNINAGKHETRAHIAVSWRSSNEVRKVSDASVSMDGAIAFGRP